MTNKLSYDKLLKYMEIVLDLEKNIYVQKNTMKNMIPLMSNLGISKSFKKPTRKIIYSSEFFGIFIFFFFKSIPIALIIGLVLLFISAIIYSVSFQNTLDSKSYFITIIIFMIIIYVVVLISFMITLKKNYQTSKDEAEKEYENNIANYNYYINSDKKRVETEIIQQKYMKQQYDTIMKLCNKEQEKLNELYSYNILAPGYRNMIAVSSIYEYLKDGRTRSLEVDGGDKGAYNIFREEQLLNRIITNTDVIIKKLDILIDNQRELYFALQEANQSINYLTESVNISTSRLEKQIQNGMNIITNNQEINNYEQRRQTAELEYMNFMNTLYLYK
ncbi:MAG: hypothetical protein IJ192_02805 [Clostridia bacterium]|nr:hypothetical protein [Clostridia bacterium]